MLKSIEELLTDERFRKYVLNPNQGDSSYWEQWKREHARNAESFEQAKSIIKEFYEPLSAEEFQAEAINFKRRIDITKADKKDIISLYEHRRRRRNPWFMRIAASLLLLVSAFFVVSFYLNDAVIQERAEYDPNAHVISKEAGRGQKLTITFQDGTKVYLNSESLISYPEQFSPGIREVELSGEAYFDVEHYEEWPFVVKTRNVQTSVLGTSFNISSYPEDSEVTVALLDGSVEVRAFNKAPVKLTPRKMVQVNEEKGKIEVLDFDIQKVVAWKDDRIIFEKASFDDVQATLERWYNVEFIYDKKPVFEGGYTGEFTNQSLEAVLTGMSSYKFKYDIEGKKVFIN